MKQLYLEVRCGRLEQAQTLCLRCGQPWRAATFEGWRLFHDPNYERFSTEKRDNILPIEGNPNRYKSIYHLRCSISPYEYEFLSGDWIIYISLYFKIKTSNKNPIWSIKLSTPLYKCSLCPSLPPHGQHLDGSWIHPTPEKRLYRPSKVVDKGST